MLSSMVRKFWIPHIHYLAILYGLPIIPFTILYIRQTMEAKLPPESKSGDIIPAEPIDDLMQDPREYKIP